MKRYEIRARFGERPLKVSKTDSPEQAERMYERFKQFAKKHELSLKIALWDAGWLCKAETI